MSQRIQAVRLAYVHYQHPRLDDAVQFLKEFGLVEVRRENSRIYLAGFGADPYVYIAEKAPSGQRAFVGGTWAVESHKDLEAAASHPYSSGIINDEGPGGGKKVTITDPNGFLVGFVHGQTLREDLATQERTRIVDGEQPVQNLATEKSRVGKFRRFNHGPSPVHKVGHYGYMLPANLYKNTYKWYMDLMNLKPTDAVFDPKTGEDTTCFFHVDRGLTHTDHHSFFLGVNPLGKPPFVHHSSFEVNDWDTQALGHKWLAEKGYTNCWGIGRHVLGSQIFDYWFDASGNIIEHYSDGDLVNESTPFTRSEEAPNSLYIWGPNVPLGFVTGNPADAGVDAAPPGGEDAPKRQPKAVGASG